MKKTTLTVVNESGLHARPAAQLTQLAQSFESEITIESAESQANAKSIIDLLSAGFNMGMEIEVTADGPDEERAIEEISALISGFSE